MATNAPKGISKNARTGGVNTQKFFCPCGGEVKIVTAFSNGKKRVIARCEKCKTEKRKPSDFEFVI